ncbi:molybdopterin-dependent oxidoreductase [Nisaea acidiphila]|uniref:Molybdopterin-dependent oxidoreductase n=1 Tax=Nisaea acidiphila TaxID=1862145 RepID=A0A9J7AQP9_9PROT|nr:nitrate reductase [Nisaea acidiphila]UUX49494.1 molybdopterin-dependent oxidoreductase [Nisaea acidiphila]
MKERSGATVRTTCPYCGVGCGVLATRLQDGTVRIEGDPDHPANYGRLCSKGSALGETVDLEGRLLHPEIGGTRASWDEALELVASRFSETIAEHGPDSVAFYVSGQLLTEDYYVANKLMKGFIGSANIDTNSRLCMASSVAGHKRAFGEDIVPGTYEDLEEADLLVLVGSNLAWCHPVLFQRVMAARERRPGMKIVVIDPRRTVTGESADLHLALDGDSDAALFNGLLRFLFECGAINRDYIARHTSGFDDALGSASEWTVEAVAGATGLPAREIEDFYSSFAMTDRVVTVYSQGVNQSASGTDKVNAIINCHLATGRIGRPGAGPFSVTGQPNAMGGREVGGLANQLAAHMDLGDPEARAIVGEFWQSDRVAERPGLKAVELFDAVADGRIKALWVMATNPADSLPNADLVEKALADCPFVVVSDVMSETDTTRHANVLLPATAWGEKDGTVTNSERRISRQRPFLPAPGDARHDWWIVNEVARRMGFAEAFPHRSPTEIYREHARLSAFRNDGDRVFSLAEHRDIAAEDYEAMAPVQWPLEDGATGRQFVNGGFTTADGRARMLPVRPPERKMPLDGSFRLNTGRVRDHWHTMTRTGKSPRLSRHIAEPFLQIHPADADAVGLEEAGLARIDSPFGSALLRVFRSDRVARGSLFAPMHWTGQLSSKGRIGAVIRPDTDPVSGQPAAKSAPVTVTPVRAAWYGFAVLRDRPAADADYWALAAAEGGWRLELAGERAPEDWQSYTRALFGMSGEQQILSFVDARSGQRRFAAFEGSRLIGALFVAPEPVPASRNWAAGLLTTVFERPQDRLHTLAGRPGAGEVEEGAIVCSCFGVGFNRIATAIGDGTAATVEEVGECLSAGTNCGSCRGEIQRIIDHAHRQKAG